MSIIESFGSSLGEAIGQLLREGKLKHLLKDAVQHYARSVAFFKTRIDEGMTVKIPSNECEVLGLKPGDFVAVLLVKIEVERHEQFRPVL